jgi:hypothetical protein
LDAKKRKIGIHVFFQKTLRSFFRDPNQAGLSDLPLANYALTYPYIASTHLTVLIDSRQNKEELGYFSG